MSLWERYSALTEVVEQLERAVASGDDRHGGTAGGPRRGAVGRRGRSGRSSCWPSCSRRRTRSRPPGGSCRRPGARSCRGSRRGRAAGPGDGDGGGDRGQRRALVGHRPAAPRPGERAWRRPTRCRPTAPLPRRRWRQRNGGSANWPAQQATLPGRLSAAERLSTTSTGPRPTGGRRSDATRRRSCGPGGSAGADRPGRLRLRPPGASGLAGAARDLADDGSWLAAGEGLDRWEEVAGGWVANARAVLAANRAPLDRRAELRGLLDAYAAKAAAIGRAEDPALADLHDAAHDALHTAPCDLDAATDPRDPLHRRRPLRQCPGERPRMIDRVPPGSPSDDATPLLRARLRRNGSRRRVLRHLRRARWRRPGRSRLRRRPAPAGAGAGPAAPAGRCRWRWGDAAGRAALSAVGLPGDVLPDGYCDTCGALAAPLASPGPGSGGRGRGGSRARRRAGVGPVGVDRRPHDRVGPGPGEPPDHQRADGVEPASGRHRRRPRRRARRPDGRSPRRSSWPTPRWPRTSGSAPAAGRRSAGPGPMSPGGSRASAAEVPERRSTSSPS